MSSDLLQQLKSLGELRDSGVLSLEEFEAQKARILGSSGGSGPPSRPESIGAYRLGDFLGKGGMGVVWKARHKLASKATAQGGDVALKLITGPLAQSTEYRGRFEREADLGIRLDHPGIVRVFDLVVDGDQLALVMELVEGRSLRMLMEAEPWEWATVLARADGLLNALAHAHQHGVIHRDLKPDNILVPDDNTQPWKIADFGLARDLTALAGSGSLSQGRSAVGTYTYMAPEQEAGKRVDARADVYAFGLVLYELMAGRLPWDHDASIVAIALTKMQGLPPLDRLNPQVPRGVSRAVMTALAAEPSARPRDAGALRSELALALRKARRALPIGSVESPVERRAREAAQRQVEEERRHREEEARRHAAERETRERRAREAEQRAREEAEREEAERREREERQRAQVTARQIAERQTRDAAKREEQARRDEAAQRDEASRRDEAERKAREAAERETEARRETAERRAREQAEAAAAQRAEREESERRAQQEAADAARRAHEAEQRREARLRAEQEAKEPDEDAAPRRSGAGKVLIAGGLWTVLLVFCCGVMTHDSEETSAGDEAATLTAALKPAPSVAVAPKWSPPLDYAMVEIPAGSFTMGSPASEDGRDDDETQHPVTLTRGFWLGKTEVTQGLWASVMGDNPSEAEYKGVSLLGDELPVQNVSWLDAVKFANALSAREGLEACYAISGETVTWPNGLDCAGFRLPTEAEWEYAARAGSSGRYAGTDDERSACQYANVNTAASKKKFDWSWDAFPCEESHLGAAPVGSFRSNAWDLHDMTGNVWEWCWDRHGGYEPGENTDPVGASRGENRVYRGGSWFSSPRDARLAFRNWVTPGNRSNSLGLRLARSAVPEG